MRRGVQSVKERSVGFLTLSPRPASHHGRCPRTLRCAVAVPSPMPGSLICTNRTPPVPSHHPLYPHNHDPSHHPFHPTQPCRPPVPPAPAPPGPSSCRAPKSLSTFRRRVEGTRTRCWTCSWWPRGRGTPRGRRARGSGEVASGGDCGGCCGWRARCPRRGIGLSRVWLSLISAQCDFQPL